MAWYEKIMGSSTAVLRAFRVYWGTSMLSKMRIAALAACIYQIWNARNRALFENEALRAKDIFKNTKLIIFGCIPLAIDRI